MENKKCSKCGHLVEDDTLEICPVCGEKLDEQSGTDDLTIQNEQTAEMQTDMQDIITEEKPKADKKLKVITASVAFILVLALGLFGWYLLKGKDSEIKDMEFKDIEGVYYSQDNSNYFEFKIEDAMLEVEDSSNEENTASSAETALSSSEVASDASDTQTKTKTLTFDGTYKSGYTLEYVQDILAQEYVIRNNLNEEYQEYLEKSGLILDDYLNFVKVEKGVSQSELDAIDKEAQYSLQRLQYDQSGYWNYDEETKEIVLYGPDGTTKIADLKVVGDAIIDPMGFFAGKYSDGEKISSTFTYSGEGINETLTFYDDGNYIIKAEYEGQSAQYIAGTYQADSKYIVLNINGQKTPHVKVKGGIASLAFTKQK